MQRGIPAGRLLTAGAFAATAVAGPLSSVAHAGPSAPAVPGAIEVPAGHKVFLAGQASGVQIYRCNAATGSWNFVAPRADLHDVHGKHITTHFGGPTWQATDDSSVVGRLVEDVTVVASAIPWLLISATSTAAGPDGDRLAGTTFIQRTATTGGLAPPKADCNTTTPGTTAEVPYTADYHFWKATGS